MQRTKKNSMIARLDIELLDNRINIDKSSLLQGVLMENIDTEYASFLHSNQLRPYTQSVIKKDGKTFWRINTLNAQAYEEIILNLMKPSFDSFYLKHNDLDIKLGKKTYESMSYQQLIDNYADNCNKTTKVSFITPTTFKKEGRYYNIPDTKLIFNSLMNKFNVFSGGKFEDSRELITLIVDSTLIEEYNLRSSRFRLEGTTVKSFIGSIDYRFSADSKVDNIAMFLLAYGCYCGVGTKCAIGMGAIEVE